MNTRALRFLLILFVVLISYGSIYPADFQMPAQDVSQVVRQFLQTCCDPTHIGDIIGNVLLFMPYGFLGALSTIRSRKSLPGIIASTTCSGVLLAFALQVVQVFLPSRDPSLQDVVFNLVGIVIGAGVGVIARHYVHSSSVALRSLAVIPCLLISAWLAYRLIPFVPTLDFQSIKNAVKPLLFDPQLLPARVANDAVAWCLVAYYLRHAYRSMRLDLFLPVMMVVVFSMEVIIAMNSVNINNVVGAAAALLLWFALVSHIRRPEYVLVVALTLVLIVTKLDIRTIHEYAIPFQWLPFKGFLGGSMLTNAQSICEKTFFYGSLVYVLWRCGLKPMTSTVLATVVIAGIEWAQTIFGGRHIPEITDPILVVLIAMVLFSFPYERAGVGVNAARSAQRYN